MILVDGYYSEVLVGFSNWLTSLHANQKIGKTIIHEESVFAPFN
jgi:hypothetical protein